jgi:hypothetical protein
MRRSALAWSLASALLFAGTVQAQTPIDFDPPDRTTWKPEGCRAVPSENPVIPSRVSYRALHSDVVNSDEISSALTPVFEPDWIAEPDLYNFGPSFDDDGNLYVAPFFPYEDVVLVSNDPETGARRWAVSSSAQGFAGQAPTILNDPDTPGEQLIYVGLGDRAIAVRPDGTVVWDQPTGVPIDPDPFQNLDTGTNYVPSADALVGLTKSGYLYVLDRRTGAQLAAPVNLPGVRTPPGVPTLPPAVIALATAKLTQTVDLPAGSDIQTFIDVLLGNDAEVANFFSVDPHSSRIWVAATSPDGDDGSVDGVSTFGSLYGLDLVPAGGSYQVVEACRRSFDGGTASTPALSSGGGRVYFGDNFGKLIAMESDCSTAWELDTGDQIFGSVGVSSDKHEVYTSADTGIRKIVDRGSHGELIWNAPIEAYTDLLPGQLNVNLLLVGIGANGLFVQVGAGFPTPGLVLPQRVGIGVLDRETGDLRYFADGLEESVGVLNTGPDGAMYMGHSPLRRIFSRVLFELGQLPPTDPLIMGGVRKWTPARLDLLARDAVCAAEDRAANAFAFRGECPDSAEADVTQIRELIVQARRAGEAAVANAELSSEAWEGVVKDVDKASRILKVPTLNAVATHLGKACQALTD